MWRKAENCNRKKVTICEKFMILGISDAFSHKNQFMTTLGLKVRNL
jgi:hypothetical protein